MNEILGGGALAPFAMASHQMMAWLRWHGSMSELAFLAGLWMVESIHLLVWPGMTAVPDGTTHGSRGCGDVASRFGIKRKSGSFHCSHAHVLF